MAEIASTLKDIIIEWLYLLCITFAISVVSYTAYLLFFEFKMTGLFNLVFHFVDKNKVKCAIFVAIFALVVVYNIQTDHTRRNHYRINRLQSNDKITHKSSVGRFSPSSQTQRLMLENRRPESKARKALLKVG